MSSYDRRVSYVVQLETRQDRWLDRAHFDRKDPYVDNGEQGAAMVHMFSLRRMFPNQTYRLIVRIEEEFPVAVPEEAPGEGAAQGT